ncbi:MAG: hypothetical protein JWR73_831 [Tardiphaga sp.]|nr:hypothetical protein [Tardiphaga sp.]MDB5520796.1 hypothetical protein [Tardiphaga sp.]MDB5549153.1 hypothetical protein [Tardiphaga sp.]MDB5625029.1 hypothetical protein [Tardiphaga sp.]MDB5630521.1 hypothetical protein [Tardiphaga sp.]
MVRAAMRWAIALFYTAAGLAHLLAPDKLLSITPSWVPYPLQVVLLAGVFEIAVSLALVTKPLRWGAGVAMAVYALCVWPANFKHAMDAIDLPYVSSSWLYHGPRLAFQPVIMWWSLYAARVIDWPFGNKSTTR